MMEDMSPIRPRLHQQGEITQEQLMAACVVERKFHNKEYLQLSVE